MPSRTRDEWNIPHEIHAERSTHGVDAAISALADLQHGVVADDQLAALGLGRGAIAHRVKQRRLHRRLPGAYSVGRAGLTREGRLMAAVLSAGPGAVVSHQSAGDLRGIRPTAGARIHVTAPRKLRPRPGVLLHLAEMPADERDLVDGIPVTTPGRTLLDLAAVLNRSDLERAFERTEALRLTHSLPLAELVSRHSGCRGAAKVKALIAKAETLSNPTRSPLEDAFLAFLEEVGLPPLAVNVPLQLGGRLVVADCLWRTERLVVETDGYEDHGTSFAFVRDRRKDRLLEAAGLRVVRVTWPDLSDDRMALERDLRRLLDRAAA